MSERNDINQDDEALDLTDTVGGKRRKSFLVRFVGIVSVLFSLLFLGLVGAASGARVMASMLFGVTPYDLPTYGGAVLIFMVIAVAACLVPAARAAGVPPAVALRGE